jgi:hypothetical protein
MERLAHAVAGAGNGMVIFQKVDQKVRRPIGVGITVGARILVYDSLQNGIDCLFYLGGTPQMWHIRNAPKQILFRRIAEPTYPVVNLKSGNILALRCNLNGFARVYPRKRLRPAKNPSIVSGGGDFQKGLPLGRGQVNGCHRTPPS